MTKIKVQTAHLLLLLTLLLAACQPIQRLPETKVAVAALAETSLEQATRPSSNAFTRRSSIKSTWMS